MNFPKIPNPVNLSTVSEDELQEIYNSPITIEPILHGKDIIFGTDDRGDIIIRINNKPYKMGKNDEIDNLIEPCLKITLPILFQFYIMYGKITDKLEFYDIYDTLNQNFISTGLKKDLDEVTGLYEILVTTIYEDENGITEEELIAVGDDYNEFYLRLDSKDHGPFLNKRFIEIQKNGEVNA